MNHASFALCLKVNGQNLMAKKKKSKRAENLSYQGSAELINRWKRVQYYVLYTVPSII